MAAVVRIEIDRGRLTRAGDGETGPLPGLFCVAMGKYGAFELNYSSDIDISFFYEPSALPLAEGVEHHQFASRFAQGFWRRPAASNSWSPFLVSRTSLARR